MKAGKIWIAVSLLIAWTCGLAPVSYAKYTLGTVQLGLGASNVAVPAGQTAAIQVQISPSTITAPMVCGLEDCPEACEATMHSCVDPVTLKCTCESRPLRTAAAELTVTTSNPLVASVTASGSAITIKGIAPGAATVSVVATLWRHASSAPSLFTVTVSEPANWNNGTGPSLPPRPDEEGIPDDSGLPVQLPPVTRPEPGTWNDSGNGGSLPDSSPVMLQPTPGQQGVIGTDLPPPPPVVPVPVLPTQSPSSGSHSHGSEQTETGTGASPPINGEGGKELSPGPVQFIAPTPAASSTREPESTASGGAGYSGGIPTGLAPSNEGDEMGGAAQLTGSGDTSDVIPQLALPGAGRPGEASSRDSGQTQPADSPRQSPPAGLDETRQGEIQAKQEQVNDPAAVEGPARLVTLTDDGPTGRIEMEEAKLSNGRVTFQKLDEAGNVIYSWTFRGADIIEPADLDMGIHFPAEPSVMRVAAESLKEPFYLHFNHEGALPGKAEVRVRLDGRYPDAEWLRLYYFNEAKQELEPVAEHLEIEADYVAFPMEHASVYALALEQSSGLSRQLAILISAGALVLVIGFIGISLTMSIKRRKSKLLESTK